MLLKDLLNEMDEARVIARAILEDDEPRNETDAWISKYYALLTGLKGSKVAKADMMLFFSVIRDEDRMYGDVSGIKYSDIKVGRAIPYAMEFSSYQTYVSLYVPKCTIEVYGAEIVAAEALREYGINDYDDRIKCPLSVRKKVFEELKTMVSGIIPIDREAHLEKCKEEFRRYYEGRE